MRFHTSRAAAFEGNAIVECAVAVIPFAGERESGDHYFVRQSGRDATVAVIDGAGHGPQAASAARKALAACAACGAAEPAEWLRRSHETLRHTRGAAMSVARFDPLKQALTWLGVGNIGGVLIRRGEAPHSLLVRAGVVGYRLPVLRASVTPLYPGDILIMTTDGIAGEFVHELPGQFFLSVSPKHIAGCISARFSKATDDGLVLVARYGGAEQIR